MVIEIVIKESVLYTLIDVAEALGMHVAYQIDATIHDRDTKRLRLPIPPEIETPIERLHAVGVEAYIVES